MIVLKDKDGPSEPLPPKYAYVPNRNLRLWSRAERVLIENFSINYYFPNGQKVTIPCE